MNSFTCIIKDLSKLGSGNLKLIMYVGLNLEKKALIL